MLRASQIKKFFWFASPQKPYPFGFKHCLNRNLHQQLLTFHLHLQLNKLSEAMITSKPLFLQTQFSFKMIKVKYFTHLNI